MNELSSINIEGCSSGSCIFKTSHSGVHTNALCQCSKDLARTENGRKAIQFIWMLRGMVDNQPKPELINGIYYCSPDCSYLRGERESVNKTCALLNKELGFYDWHLAICDEETGKEHD